MPPRERNHMSGAASEMEVEGQGLKQTAKDLFAGAAGGVAQVLIGKFEVLCVLCSVVVVFVKRCIGERKILE